MGSLLNLGLGRPAVWAERFGPLIALIHFLFFCMSVQVSVNIWHGGSPITPELYGPAVYHVPALAWTSAQCGCAALTCVAAAHRWWRVMFAGACVSIVFYVLLAALAAHGAQGTIVQAGATWVFIGLSGFTAVAGLQAGGKHDRGS